MFVGRRCPHGPHVDDVAPDLERLFLHRAGHIRLLLPPEHECLLPRDQLDRVPQDRLGVQLDRSEHALVPDYVRRIYMAADAHLEHDDLDLLQINNQHYRARQQLELARAHAMLVVRLTSRLILN